ncbi:MAG TPA: hypothetical protein VN867_04355 [Candidatus Binataceae bacterium]|nr:hypothetical protein [Candidatus Binataceae bacterium]
MAALRDRDRRLRRVIRWLTLIAMATGFLSTLIYSTGADLAIRYVNPELGAWWDAHQFAIMEVSATALGLLIAVRCAARLIEETRTRRRAKVSSLVLSAIIALPLSSEVASIARLGWDGGGAPTRNFLQGRAGYGAGNILDKIVIGSVYFLKSTALAALIGFALYAVVWVITMSFDKDGATEPAERSIP